MRNRSEHGGWSILEKRSSEASEDVITSAEWPTNWNSRPSRVRRRATRDLETSSSEQDPDRIGFQRNDHVGRSRLAELRDVIVFTIERGQPGIAGECRDKFPYSQIPVRDVEENGSIRLQLVLVNADSLARQQVRGDGIRIERIENQQIELPIWPVQDRQTPVAQNNIAAQTAAWKKREKRLAMNGTCGSISKNVMCRLGCE